MSHLLRAPFEAGNWIPALAATARATKGWNASLNGLLSADSGAPDVFLVAERPDNSDQDWLACGGADPVRNPLLLRALESPVMRCFSDADVISRDERKRHPLWNEFYFKYDAPHLCVCTLWRRDTSGLGVSVMRSGRHGPFEEREQGAFEQLMFFWRNAALITRSLKGENARLTVAALDHLSAAAILLDAFERIVAMTLAAEKIVRGGGLLRAHSGRLCSTLSSQSQVLDRAIHAGVGTFLGCGKPAEISLRGLDGRVARLRVSPLPRENDIGFGAAAMVLIEAPTQSRLEECGLTGAETSVAESILKGKSLGDIARVRKVSVLTVRSQIKSIYSKAGVHTRAEFMAL